MKYIDRWALMRNNREENLCEHCLEVSMIAHALATIGNVRYGKTLNAERAALIGLYHDASEIITGDMPTPAYEPIFFKDADDENDVYLWKLVKAADKLSALIKCMEETGSGNTEFSSAMGTIMNSVSQMAETYPEVNDFVCEFLPAYGKTLDDLQQI